MNTRKMVMAAGLALAATLAANGQTVEIQRAPLGSGEPGETGFEQAAPVAGELFHVPQYLPGFPTAATIWPRAVRVRCQNAAGVLRCEGYQWTPGMGRAEYLFFIPVIVAEPAAK